MAGVELNIVREYFETNGFFVRQLRKHHLQKRGRKGHRYEDEIDLMVVNLAYREPDRALGFILFANDLAHINRAILSVRGWHTVSFSPSTLRSSSEIFHFLERDVLRRAEELFSIENDASQECGESFMKILVLPGLPTQEPHRTQSIELLREAGVDGILSFRAMLQDIVQKVEISQNYEKSDLLQTLRLLKHYDMLHSPQMELFPKKR